MKGAAYNPLPELNKSIASFADKKAPSQKINSSITPFHLPVPLKPVPIFIPLVAGTATIFAGIVPDSVKVSSTPLR